MLLVEKLKNYLFLNHQNLINLFYSFQKTLFENISNALLDGIKNEIMRYLKV